MRMLHLHSMFLLLWHAVGIQQTDLYIYSVLPTLVSTGVTTTLHELTTTQMS